MISHARLLATLATLVKRSRAEAISVCAQVSTRRVFRFAYEAIHQALIRDSVMVTIKVIDHGRIGVASAETLEAAGLTRCLQAAREMARHTPPLPLVPPLPSRHHLNTRADHIEATTTWSPAECVASLRELRHICQGVGAQLAGSLVTGDETLAVVNSAGVACAASSTVAGAKLVTMYRKLSGYASGVDRDIRRLDLKALLQRSLRQVLHHVEPVTVPLGAYEVILEPEAVAELVTWLGYTAFGAKAFEERTSFMAGRMGEALFAPSITIEDRGTDPALLRCPFDFEGTPKQRVVLIDRGRASNIVYDTLYGARFGHASTGHGMPPNEVEGPLPLHLAMRPGASTIDQMIRACRRGLLIPRFHYVNGLLNPREALMTGLTREGTFLIEDGRLSAPVTTLRFTQSLLESFRDVRSVSAARRLVADPAQELGCALMPTLHLATFRFTGHSGH